MRIAHLLAAISLSGATLLPMSAGATGVDEASPTGKGITGGALLGAELVLVIEAAVDVKPAWAYIVGGLAGAVGGGVGGYFLESSASAKTNMFVLTGGLAFAIPTTVAVLNARAYEPPAGDVVDTGPTDEPVAEPPRAPQATLAPALVAVGKQVSLSVPSVGISKVYTRSELDQFGVAQQTQWNLPVLNWLF